MRALLMALGLVSGCSVGLPITYHVAVVNQSDWLTQAAYDASLFWAQHGIDFQIEEQASEAATLDVIEDDNLSDDEFAEFDGTVYPDGFGTVKVDVRVANPDFGKLMPSCAVAHEFGHSAGAGMQHVAQDPPSLMSPVIHPAGEDGWPSGGCAWSGLDQQELCRVLPEACEYEAKQ